MTQIRTVTVLESDEDGQRRRRWPLGWELLSRELPQMAALTAEDRMAEPLTISLAHWMTPDCNPADLDRELRSCKGSVALRLLTGTPSDERAAVQVLTRAQVFLPRRRVADADVLERVMHLHRQRHDETKPLVAADYEHALDTHCWVLRLYPQASLALQIAALFHDVERLRSEPDRRIEQHAADYQAFKDAHARGSAQLMEAWLSEIGVDSRVVRRAAQLVAEHERPGRTAEARVLSDADALSFFSLNCPGFIDYYGPEHTARKVDYTLNRLAPEQRWRLAWIKLRADVDAIVRDVRAARGEA